MTLMDYEEASLKAGSSSGEAFEFDLGLLRTLFIKREVATF